MKIGTYVKTSEVVLCALVSVVMAEVKAEGPGSYYRARDFNSAENSMLLPSQKAFEQAEKKLAALKNQLRQEKAKIKASESYSKALGQVQKESANAETAVAAARVQERQLKLQLTRVSRSLEKMDGSGDQNAAIAKENAELQSLSLKIVEASQKLKEALKVAKEKDKELKAVEATQPKEKGSYSAWSKTKRDLEQAEKQLAEAATLVESTPIQTPSSTAPVGEESPQALMAPAFSQADSEVLPPPPPPPASLESVENNSPLPPPPPEAFAPPPPPPLPAGPQSVVDNTPLPPPPPEAFAPPPPPPLPAGPQSVVDNTPLPPPPPEAFAPPPPPPPPPAGFFAPPPPPPPPPGFSLKKTSESGVPKAPKETASISDAVIQEATSKLKPVSKKAQSDEDKPANTQNMPFLDRLYNGMSKLIRSSSEQTETQDNSDSEAGWTDSSSDEDEKPIPMNPYQKSLEAVEKSTSTAEPETPEQVNKPKTSEVLEAGVVPQNQPMQPDDSFMKNFVDKLQKRRGAVEGHDSEDDDTDWDTPESPVVSPSADTTTQQIRAAHIQDEEEHEEEMDEEEGRQIVEIPERVSFFSER